MISINKVFLGDYKMKRLILLLASVLIPTFAIAQNTYTTNFISVSPTVDTSIYASGDLIGTKMTFTPAVRQATRSGVITGVIIVDQSAQASDIDLVLFSANPSATTFTDQAALDIADGDMAKIIAVIPFVAANRFAFADNGVKYAGSIMIPIKGTVNTIYGALVSRGTPTFAAATDVTVQLAISQD